MKTLKTAVKAHYELKNALAEYGKKLGDPGHPVLVAAHRACDRRAGEMISLAAQLQGRTPAELEGVMVKDALRALAVEMHGGKDILEQTAAKAEALFKKLNDLDASPDKLSASFKAKAKELDQSFKELEQKIKGELGKSEARPKKGRPVLLREAEVFKPLRQSLDQARARVGALVAPPPPLDLDRMVDEIVSLSALDKFIDKAKAALGENSSEFKAVESPLEELRGELKTLKTKLAEDLEKGLTGDVQDTLETLRKSRVPIESAQLAFGNDETGESLLKEFNGLIKPMYRAIYKNDFSLLAREIEEVGNMRKSLSQGGPRPWEREVFLKLAAENTFFSFSALMECSLRGIPPDRIECRNGPGSILAPPRELGSGVANTVTLYQFENEDGGNLELVFKPEHEAYHGLRGLIANNLGYSPLSRTVQLNTASSAVAEAIGCGGVLVKAGVGVQDGRFGLFMEKAPGRSPHDWNSELGKDPANPSRTKTHKEALREELEANGLLSTARANLQRELCRLEWADLLSGQVDRHQNNYLVDINPKTGEVKVTGIDNDASFGHNILGPGLFKAPPHWTGPTTTNDPKLGKLVDVSERKYTAQNIVNLHKAYGLNQLSLPEFIDKDTYDRLTNLDASPNGDYAKMLRQHLPDQEAVDSALSRLAKAKEHALALARKRQVVADWQTYKAPGGNTIRGHYNNSVRTEAARLGKESVAKLKLGFYARDWGTGRYSF
jgi:hypothetical protein